MGVIERRTRQKNQVRGKIIGAARRLFAAHGVDAVSMRKIADAVEYSPTAIYVHFKDKQSLLREICSSDFSALASSFGNIAAIKNPVDRIYEIGRAYARFGLENPNHYRMMFMTAAEKGLPEDERTRCGKPDEDGYSFLRSAIAQAIEARAFRRELDDADLLAQTLWAGIHGVVSLQIAKGDDPWLTWAPTKKRVEMMLDAIMHGVVRETKK